MKIAIDCRLIGASGIGTFIENIVPHMVADKCHSFLLIGDERKLEKYEQHENCEVLPCRLAAFTPAELLRFPVGEANRCDAFFTPNFNIPMGLKIPVYCTIHDIMFFDHPDFGTPVRRMALKWYVKRALRISKGIFTVSEFSRKRIHAYFHTAKDIHVVHSAISAGLADYAARHSDWERHGIVFIGNIKPTKGLSTLIDAYEKLKAKGERKELTIVGNFNFRTRDDQMVERLRRMQGDVRFVTGASNEEVYRILSESELLVSPSLYEGFGLPPLEAMYLGANVILSDIPVYKEIYADFPVTYFRCGDADDLSKKIEAFRYKPLEVRAEIDRHYNFREIAAHILHDIANSRYSHA